jgi:hypothetical protein
MCKKDNIVQKTGKDKKERNSILSKVQERIEQWMSKWWRVPYTQIARYPVNMKPDNDQAGKCAHPIK